MRATVWTRPWQSRTSSGCVCPGEGGASPARSGTEVGSAPDTWHKSCLAMPRTPTACPLDVRLVPTRRRCSRRCVSVYRMHIPCGGTRWRFARGSRALARRRRGATGRWSTPAQGRRCLGPLGARCTLSVAHLVRVGRRSVQRFGGFGKELIRSRVCRRWDIERRCLDRGLLTLKAPSQHD
jgi:hypothetical protein